MTENGVLSDGANLGDAVAFSADHPEKVKVLLPVEHRLATRIELQETQTPNT